MDLSYPIGKFTWPASVSTEERAPLLDLLVSGPDRYRQAVAGLDNSQLDTPYRPGGWTVRQVIHHMPDSHMNVYCRCRLALTEDNPPIKGYNEAKWAELHDARTGPVEPSLMILEGVHSRWVSLFRSLSDAEWARTFDHSEYGAVRLDSILALYGWHTRHHAAHITGLRERMGWK
jgi:hypothetical protein